MSDPSDDPHHPTQRNSPRDDRGRDVDWEAWEIDPLPRSFADSVLATIADGPAQAHAALEAAAATPTDNGAVVLAMSSAARIEPRPPLRPPPRPPRLATLATAIVVAAAAVAVVWSWPSRSPLSGIAARPTSEDAVYAWTSIEPAVAQHSAGSVRWDIAGDVPVTINTAAGTVSTDHAAFTLELLDMSRSLKKPALVTGVALTGAVAAAIWVHSGDVEVANAHGTKAVAAGSAAVMTYRQAPQSVDGVQREAPPMSAPAVPVAQGPAAWTRARAQIKDALAQRAPSAALPHQESGSSDDALPHEAAGLLSKDYIRQTIHDDVLPLVKECYNSVLEDDPELEGKMVLEFSILGDPSVGGIVDSVEFVEGTQIAHPDFRECVGESMASSVFEPPEGGGQVVVRFPFVFQTAATAAAD